MHNTRHQSLKCLHCTQTRSCTSDWHKIPFGQLLHNHSSHFPRKHPEYQFRLHKKQRQQLNLKAGLETSSSMCWKHVRREHLKYNNTAQH
jgi:hypothetical protein